MPAEEEAAAVAPTATAEEEEMEMEAVVIGRLRMSFIPCGVAEELSCGEPSPDDRPVELLMPGEDTAMPPGLGEVVAGEVEESGYAGYSGVFISVMLCRAANGGVLRRKALCRDPSI